MKKDDLTGFRQWLVEKKGFSDRSAGNTLSRLNRVEAVNADTLKQEKCAFAVSIIEDTNQFFTFTVSVRSQLRRAIRLWYEYNR